MTVYVAGEPSFTDHPAVANGASDLLVDVLGEPGRHARVAVGVASLPLGTSVEVAVTAELPEAQARRFRSPSGGTADRRRGGSRPCGRSARSKGRANFLDRAECFAERAHGDAAGRRPHEGRGPLDERGREDELFRDPHRPAPPRRRRRSRRGPTPARPSSSIVGGVASCSPPISASSRCTLGVVLAQRDSVACQAKRRAGPFGGARRDRGADGGVDQPDGRRGARLAQRVADHRPHGRRSAPRPPVVPGCGTVRALRRPHDQAPIAASGRSPRRR